jgi:hypothetical protein
MSAIRMAGNDVDQPHQDGVDLSTEVCRHDADRGAGRERNDGRDDADEQAEAQAVEDRRHHVAALLIGAEPIELAVEAALARRQHVVHDVQLSEIIRVLRRNPGREDRHDDQQHDQCERTDREPAFGELAPRARRPVLRRDRSGFDFAGVDDGHHASFSVRRTRGSSSV